jgi:DNA (cytosine-5)-methyltransferase 1
LSEKPVLLTKHATRRYVSLNVTPDLISEIVRQGKRIRLGRTKWSLQKPGGTWRDWPKHLIAKCHTKKTGKTYPGVYGRMKYEEAAPTLTTQFYGFGNGRFGHPTQARGLSLREGALLQGFPKDYSFLPDDEPLQFKALGRMIGNAVPVDLGSVIGQSIIEHVKQHVGQPPSSTTQRRGRNGREHKGSAVHA